MRNGKKAARLDRQRCSRNEAARAKESDSRRNRSDPKANRRRDAAKGVQHWVVVGFASLRLLPTFSRFTKLRKLRDFFLLFHRQLFNWSII